MQFFGTPNEGGSPGGELCSRVFCLSCSPRPFQKVSPASRAPGSHLLLLRLLPFQTVVWVVAWGSCFVFHPHPDWLSPKLSATPSWPNSALGWPTVQLRGGRGGGKNDGNQGPCQPLLLVPGKILGTGSPTLHSPGPIRPQIQRCWLEWAAWVFLDLGLAGGRQKGAGTSVPAG